MTAHPRPKPKPPARTLQPAELVVQWGPRVRSIDPDAELDFSFAKDAITICDMRVPNALRYGILFTRKEVTDDVYKTPGEVERRVKEFMR